MVTSPLEGVRVLDLTNVLSGPFCCYQLGLLGAEVIKIERPGTGDLARELGADPARNAALMGISFLAQNAGKSSVSLDLKAPRGKDLFRRLVKTADVVVENFRPGVMDRLGLGYETLRDDHPQLIYCAISGFGQTGPRKDDPAYDQIVQGLSGVMSITGTPGTAPNRVGYPLADTIGGMTAAFAIGAALNARPRGGFVDIAMTEAVLATMGWVVSNFAIGGVDPAPQGNENPTSAPSGTFATADRPINIAANRDQQWQALAQHLGRADLLENPLFATRQDRKANRDALRSALEQTLKSIPAAEWIQGLTQKGVPCGLVLTVPEALADAQTAARQFMVTLDNGGEDLRVAASPIVMDGQRPSPATAPPDLGQDTDVILRSLGLSGPDIAALKKDKII